MKKNLLHLQNISLQIDMNSKKILSHIQLEVHTGEFFVILGANGSGKSSLLKLIDRQYTPTSGKILFHQKPLQEYSSKMLSTSIKTLTQNSHESLFSSLTLFENYLIFSQKTNSKQSMIEYQEYMAQFNTRLSTKPNECVLNLSGGEKQALILGLMLIIPPTLLLLDEHTSALDPKSAKRIMELTKKMAIKHNMTCLMTTHDLEEAKLYATDITALKEGKIHHQIKNTPNVSIHDLLESCF